MSHDMKLIFKVLDNIKTGRREFYDKEGHIIMSYAREVLHDKDFKEKYGNQLPWGAYHGY